MEAVSALAVDLGSASGRIVAGTYNGERLTVKEIYRFAHEPQLVSGDLVWDLDMIWEETLTGIRKALTEIENPLSISVDTWGVDMVLLDANGQKIGPAYSYRDERTSRTYADLQEVLPDAEAWEDTGTAPATINSSNQLFALLRERPDLARQVAKVLWLPDYFIYKLSGQMGWSRSIVSTSGLCEPSTLHWSKPVLQKLGIPVDWFGPLTAELSVAGKCVIPGLTQLFVVRGGGHDTACAVHSLPQIGGGQESAKETVWLSCGSWSILGALTEQPIMSGPALECGVTNEVCTDGRIRPLLNLTGLWILQECQRHWAFTGQESDIAALVSAASQAPSLGVAIDTNDPEFVAPFDMVNRVQAYLQRNFGLQADSPGQLVRVILESLALRYAKGVGDLEDVTGQRFKVFHLLGGGSRNELLCDLAAGATGLPVSAGPAEASAFGALISQFETLGVTQPSQRQQIIAGSTTTRWHLPDNPVGQAVDWAKLRSQSLKTIN